MQIKESTTGEGRNSKCGNNFSANMHDYTHTCSFNINLTDASLYKEKEWLIKKLKNRLMLK